jgi:hypothetical protein
MKAGRAVGGDRYRLVALVGMVDAAERGGSESDPFSSARPQVLIV